MPTYSDAYYNSAALIGGDDALEPISFGKNGRREFYYNAAGVYGGSELGFNLSGGWALPFDPSHLISPAMVKPTPGDFTNFGNAMFNAKQIDPVIVEEIYAQAEKQFGQDVRNDPDFDKLMKTFIGAMMLYDTYRLLSIPEIGHKYLKLGKRQMMLARNRAALLALVIDDWIKTFPNPTVGSTLFNLIYNIIHRKRPERKALLEEYAKPVPYSFIEESVMPAINPHQGYGRGKNVIPWSMDWDKLSPELEARAIGLFNKATSKGVMLDPTTLAKAAKGEYVETAAPPPKTKKKKAGVPVRPARMVKGSPEAKAYMAALRAKRVSSESGGKKKRKTRKTKGGSASWNSYLAKTYGY